MIMFGLEFTGREPFGDVHLTGIVRDAEGRKMSKSAGNTIDPMALIDAYGADALRFTLMFSAAPGTDLHLATEKVEVGRNFANKLWNAARFVLLNLGDEFSAGPLDDVDTNRFDLADRWILTRLMEVRRAVDEALDDFRPNDVANLLFDFLKHDYCDWYVEWAKVRLADPEAGPQVRRLLVGVLEEALRLLHPLMPFLTEEIWGRLPLADRRADSISLAPWGGVALPERPEAVAEMASLQALIGAIRDLRQQLKVPAGKKPRVIVISPSQEVRERILANREQILRLSWSGEIEVSAAAARPAATASAVLADLEIFLPLEGLIDVDGEKLKLERERERIEKLLDAATRRLASQEFRERAPEDVVRREEEKRSEFRTILERLERNLEAIR
jgi:valyl-tRNA synthetase